MKDMFAYDAVVQKMRQYFREAKGFVEVPTQSRQSILAACEDPATISQYIFGGTNWPLPQTGQMWLEYELLKNPTLNGVFCVTTSYRNEPNPVPGRHDKIFPMFEFELKGGIDELRKVEQELLHFLGFRKTEGEYPWGDYEDVSKRYGVDELEHEHEKQLETDHGPVFFLENFPKRTSPFWNMRLHEGGKHSNKIDVILHGMETIGSAERSTNTQDMEHMFRTISNGDYANTLYAQFSKERVENELNEFLQKKFFERSGGGIGVTRMIRAMKLSNLLG